MHRPTLAAPVSWLLPLLVPVLLTSTPSPASAQAKPTAPAKAQPTAQSTAQPTADRITLVTVSGADYAFKAPQLVPSGVVTFNLVNNGSDLHAMTLLKLPANHTLREFLDMYHDKEIIPPWMPTLGQTETIAPQKETFLTARLTPGTYVLACLIPTRDGRAHTEKGMVQTFTVK